MPKWIERGSPSSPVWIVAEAPGRDEVEQGRPLVGASGQEAEKMFRAAGWPNGTHDLFVTNICHERPPSYQKKGKWIHNDIEQFFPGVQAAKREGLPLLHGRYPRPPVQEGLARLRSMVQQYRPRLILCLGGTALWGLCGEDGITKWRGSVLPATNDFLGCKCVCTLHPAIVADPSKGQYTFRPVIIQDLRRAKTESAYPEIRRPAWEFVTAPTPSQIQDWLQPCVASGTPLVSDTEGWGVVDCIGFAKSSTQAICIPFTKGDGSSFYSPDDECQVFGLVAAALTKCPQTFHNATWDMQVICKNWGVYPRLHDDTLVAQHVAFPGLLGGKIDPTTGRVDKKGSSLSLSFCASMYCDYYRFWKEDGRLRNPDATDEDEWRYNCEDCVRTWEVRDNLVERIIPAAGLVEQYRFLMRLFRPVLRMMFQGIRVDHEAARRVKALLSAQRAEQQSWLDTVLGYPLSVHSNHPGGQMQSLFFDDLQCENVRSRKTGNLSTDDVALETLARKYPMLVPLIRHCQNIRSIDTNDSTFIRPVEGGWYTVNKKPQYFQPAGERLYTCLNIAGPETMRFSSNETAFGEGMNLQNLTRPE